MYSVYIQSGPEEEGGVESKGVNVSRARWSRILQFTAIGISRWEIRLGCSKNRVEGNVKMETRERAIATFSQGERIDPARESIPAAPSIRRLRPGHPVHV